MRKNPIITRLLVGIAVLCGLTLVVWAIATPLLQRRESTQLVDEARSLLSPPIKGLMDLDAVDCDRARQLLSRAVELSPSNGVARRELPLAEGCSALLRGDLLLAEGGLRSAASSMPSDPRPHRWLGSLALAREETDEALRAFRRGLELAPENIPCRVGVSDTLAEMGRPEEALETLEALMNESELPPLALLEVRRGMLHEDLGQLEEARAAYERAAELSPDMAEPLNNLAALEREAGDLETAWATQQRAIELSPDDPVMLLNAGLLAVARGHDEEALEYLRRSAELDVQSPNAPRALADHLLLLGRAEEALQVLGTALERHARNAALRNTLGNALAAAGRAEEARRAYLTAIELDARSSHPHNGLAVLMMSAGDLDGAERALERALELEPGNRQARRNLSLVLQRRATLETASLDVRFVDARHTED